MAHYQTPVDLTSLSAWQALSQHREGMQTFQMREAFAQDPQRFERFSLSTCGLFLDYSKNVLTEETRNLLVRLAEDVGLRQAIDALMRGEPVNGSERRPALHTALRRPMGEAVYV